MHNIIGVDFRAKRRIAGGWLAGCPETAKVERTYVKEPITGLGDPESVAAILSRYMQSLPPGEQTAAEAIRMGLIIEQEYGK